MRQPETGSQPLRLGPTTERTAEELMALQPAGMDTDDETDAVETEQQDDSGKENTPTARPDWTPVSEDDLKASATGFEMRRHKYGRLALYRRPVNDKDELYVGNALWTDGMARDTDGGQWCTVVRFVDCDGQMQQWLMPRETLVGDRAEPLRQLYTRGYDSAPSKEARDALAAYLCNKPKTRLTTVRSTGWHGDSFVLPTRTIGPGNFLLVNRPSREATAGTAIGWRDSIGAACVGNSRLIFAVSAGFASPLLKIAGAESGGIHLVGQSSKGKTTALVAACSIWSAEPHQWRATDNGLEGVAARHSDCGLVLDEIGQADGKVAGEIAYMLANGAGKSRARRDGSDREPSRWRLIFMSTGEQTLAEQMTDSGKRAKTGQEIRLVNIEADAGKDMGTFEDTHDMEPALFAEKIAADAKRQHGTAGPEFVEYLVGNEHKVRSVIAHVRDKFDARPDVLNADGQVRRVARRFHSGDDVLRVMACDMDARRITRGRASHISSGRVLTDARVSLRASWAW